MRLAHNVFTVVGLLTVFGCTAPAPAPPAPPAELPAPPAQSPSTMIVVPYENAKFIPVSASQPNGAQLAVLRGDPATGPSAMLMKVMRGSGPLHTHTSDYHLVLIRGSMKHWGEGESETNAPTLQPGSYWFQPGGVVHGDACLVDECLMQVVWSGPRDGKLAATPKP